MFLRKITVIVAPLIMFTAISCSPETTLENSHAKLSAAETTSREARLIHQYYRFLALKKWNSLADLMNSKFSGASDSKTHSKNGFLKLTAQRFSSFSNLKVQPTFIGGQKYKGTSFVGIYATFRATKIGKPVTWREAKIFALRDGKITNIFSNATRIGIEMQLKGEMPPVLKPLKWNKKAGSYSFSHLAYVVKRYQNEIMNAHNVENADRVLTQNFIEHSFGPGENADLKTYKSFAGGAFKAFPDLKAQYHIVFGRGDIVGAIAVVTGTHTGGPLFGIPATGKRVRWTETHLFRVRGTKISEHWGEADLLGVMNQLRK